MRIDVGECQDFYYNSTMKAVEDKVLWTELLHMLS